MYMSTKVDVVFSKTLVFSFSLRRPENIFGSSVYSEKAALLVGRMALEWTQNGAG